MKLLEKIKQYVDLEKEIRGVLDETEDEQKFYICPHFHYDEKVIIGLFKSPHNPQKVIYEDDYLAIEADDDVKNLYKNSAEKIIEEVIGIERKELKW